VSKFYQTPNPAYPHVRQHPRFSLEYPVRMRFHTGDSAAEVEAITRNVSIGGLLLRTAAMIPQHTAVNFVMTVQGGQLIRPVHLAGEGEVVRVEPEEVDGRFGIAVRCQKPLTQIEDCLLAS